MGCTFTVSLDELRQVGTTLSRTASELSTLGDVREDYDCILGDDEVRDEVHAFFQHWSDGMHRIGEHVNELADHVNTAVDAYEQTENTLIADATPTG
jgi:hypothetical protein